MRFSLFLALLFAFIAVLNAADEAIPIAGNFSVVIPPGAGHQTPAVNFFRELERTLRQNGRLGPDSGGRGLVAILHEDQKDSAKFVYSPTFRTQVLQLPIDYRKIVDDPQLGRTLLTALIQNRIGSRITDPLPEAAYWIADGIWAEFVYRQKFGTPIMRFVYLPAMRNIAEMGFNPSLTLPLLTLPAGTDLQSVQGELYLQRARLMLETVRILESRKSSNLIKDYLLLLQGGKLSPKQCFERTFAAAARNKFSAAQNLVPGQSDTEFGYEALSYAALQTLFSSQSPMAPAAVERRFHAICQVEYVRAEKGQLHKAHINDLPSLVEKYESCRQLPRLKIWQLNMLAAVAPGQVRGEIFDLTKILTGIGSDPAAKLSNELKNTVSELLAKLNLLKNVDNVLANYENEVMPLLYNQRLQLENPAPAAELPPRIQNALDQAEKLRYQ